MNQCRLWGLGHRPGNRGTAHRSDSKQLLPNITKGGRDAAKCFREALAGLPIDQREAIVLMGGAGLSCELALRSAFVGSGRRFP